MKNNKARGSDGMPADAREMFNTKYKETAGEQESSQTWTTTTN
jgi:hypothetical protein